MKSKLNKITTIISTVVIVILCIVIFVNLCLQISAKVTGESNPTFLGFTYAIVKTNSMAGDAEDSFEGGDLVFVMRRRDYKINDIVMMRGTGYSVTHRIVDITDEGYITKGDANNTIDTVPVPKDKIIGKVFLTIPEAGFFLAWLQTPAARCLLICIVLLIIALPMLFRDSKGGSGSDTETVKSTDEKTEDSNAIPESKDTDLGK